MTGIRFIAAVLVMASLSACAAIMSDDESTSYIETDPENARCELHGQDFVRVVNTPNSIHLPAEAAPMTIACKAEGYKTTTQTVDTTIDGWIWGNILLGGGIGFLIDAGTDSGEEFPPHISIVLEPIRFQTRENRDEWYTRRRAIAANRWQQSITAAEQQCSDETGSGETPGWCENEIRELQQKRDQDLEQWETKRLTAKLGTPSPEALGNPSSANAATESDGGPHLTPQALEILLKRYGYTLGLDEAIADLATRDIDAKASDRFSALPEVVQEAVRRAAGVR